MDFERIKQDRVSRRAFMARMSAAGLGAAAAGLFGDFGTIPAFAQTSRAVGKDDPVNFPGIPGRTIDEVVLNFALTLEILEADLYRQALNRASGRPLNAPLGNESDYSLAIPAANINPNSGQAVPDAFLFLRQFTFVEAAHRDFLRAAIQAAGGTPTTGNPRGYRFPTPGGNPGDFLVTILVNILPLEETGVRAYLGGAGFLTSLSLIQTAATIFSTEARHSAVISDALGFDPGPRFEFGDKLVTPRQPTENTFEFYLDPPVVINRVMNYFVK